MRRFLTTTLLLLLAALWAAPGWATFTVTCSAMPRSLHLTIDDLTEIGGEPKRAELFWRANGDSTWKRAQDMRRTHYDYILGTGSAINTMAGVVMGLAEGAAYDWKITVTKQDDSTDSMEGLNVTTTSLSPPVGSATTLTVTTGDTVATVVKNFMNDANPDPGKTVEFAAGTYRSGILTYSSPSYDSWSWSGDASAWIDIRPASGATVIFDGSDPAYDGLNTGLWELVDGEFGLVAADGVYRSVGTFSYFPEAVLFEEAPGGGDANRLQRITHGDTWGGGGGNHATGIRVPRSSTIYKIKQMSSTYFNIWCDQDPYIHAGDTITVSGNAEASFNGTFTVWTVYRPRAGTLVEVGQSKWVVSVQQAGTANTIADGGTLTTTATQSTMKRRVTATPGEPLFAFNEASATGHIAGDGKLYVHLANGADPNTKHMKVCKYRSPLDIYAGAGTISYVKISGFTFRYFGEGQKGIGGGSGMDGGIHLMSSASNILIQDCTFKGTGSIVTDKGLNTGVYKDRITVDGCTIREVGLYPTGGAAPVEWEHLKNTPFEHDANGIAFLGRQVAVLDTTFHGVNNGVSYAPAAAYANQDWHVDNCDFEGITDDAMELEVGVKNVLVSRNRFRYCYKAIAGAPNLYGPMWVVRNTVWALGEYPYPAYYKQASTKFGNSPGNYGGDTAEKVWIHNTLIAQSVVGGVPDPAGTLKLVGLSTSGASFNLTALNNIVVADTRVIDFADDANAAMGYSVLMNGNAYIVRSASPDFAYQQYNNYQDEGTGHRATASFANWQAGVSELYGTNWPGYDGLTGLHDYTWTDGDSVSRTDHWLHDPDGAAYVPAVASTYLAAPYAGTMEGVAPLAALVARGVKDGTEQTGTAGLHVGNIAWDCGPEWSAYEEAGDPTPGAVPYASGTTHTVTVPAARGRVGTTIEVTVTSASSGTISGLTFTCKTAGGVDVAGVTGTPAAIAPDGHSASVTLTIPLPATAGDLTVTATSTDESGTATGSGTVAVRRATGAAVVVG